MSGLTSLKAIRRAVKDKVMSFSEMELAVREATNNDPGKISCFHKCAFGWGMRDTLKRQGEFPMLMNKCFCWWQEEPVAP